jgi:hypothetical protein
MPMPICAQPGCARSLSRRDAVYCHQHANLRHGFTSETASRAAVRRLELERAGKEALKRELERRAHGGSDG